VDGRPNRRDKSYVFKFLRCSSGGFLGSFGAVCNHPTSELSQSVIVRKRRAVGAN